MDNLAIVKTVLLYGLGFSVVAFVLFKFDSPNVSTGKIFAAFAFAACLFIVANISGDKVSELGFGALKVKIDRKIQEADTVLSKLRDLTALIMKPVSMIAAGTNNTAAQRNAYLAEMKATLKGLGLADEAYDEFLEDYHRTTVSMLLSKAVDSLSERLTKVQNANCIAINPQNENPCKIYSETRTKLNQSPNDIILQKLKPLDAYKEFDISITKMPFLTDLDKKELLDAKDVEVLRYYCATGTFDPKNPNWRPYPNQ